MVDDPRRCGRSRPFPLDGHSESVAPLPRCQRGVPGTGSRGRRVPPSVGPYAGEMGKARHGRDPLPPARAHVPRVDPVPGDDVVVPMEWPADAVTTVEDTWD